MRHRSFCWVGRQNKGWRKGGIDNNMARLRESSHVDGQTYIVRDVVCYRDVKGSFMIVQHTISIRHPFPHSILLTLNDSSLSHWLNHSLKYFLLGHKREVCSVHTRIEQGLSMNKFPEDSERAVEWQKLIQIKRLDKKNSRICSNHFKNISFIVRFLWSFHYRQQNWPYLFLGKFNKELNKCFDLILCFFVFF